VNRRRLSPVIDVLLVEDNTGDVRLVREAFANAKVPTNLQIASNGIEALKRLAESAKPHLILTDMQMPVMNGIELVDAVKLQYPELPVVLMTAFGTEEIALQVLRKGAVSCVPKANLLRDLVGTITGILEVSGADHHYRRMLSGLQHIDTRFDLDNDASLIAPLIAYLDDHLICLGLTDEIGLIRIGVAVREALLNAIYHGNLEFSSEELLQASRLRVPTKTLEALVDERRKSVPFRHRQVHLKVQLSRSCATYVIQDEGPGFNWTEMPDPTNALNLERESGRGLLLIRTFMDRVTFNDSGNAVTLVKYADKHESPHLPIASPESR
jgi:CheY-like chemotaxis protein